MHERVRNAGPIEIGPCKSKCITSQPNSGTEAKIIIKSATSILIKVKIKAGTNQS